ncbi:4'-phosphopantetheinyl transferase family protein [Chitinophagaceae bacterium LWZ2-11]
MPLFYQQNINVATRLAVWKIEEDLDFFLQKVPLKREITHPHKKLQHLAGRYLLRFLYPEFPNEEILIADTRKPFLPAEQYHFSISHCGNYAAAIVSTDKRVGIDIEIPTEKVLRIRNKFLHEEELNLFPVQSTEHLIEHSTVLWSAKEAMFKWWGRGEVDFKEMMRLDAFSFKQQGTINGCFTKESVSIDLQLHYQIFEELCLVWLMSETGHFFI